MRSRPRRPPFARSALAPSVVRDSLLSPHYLIAKNGLHFTADLETPLAQGDVLVGLSAGVAR
jgi:hypothetical protein